MTGAELVGLVLAGGLMLAGLAGTVIPGIPGAPLILAAAIGHKLYFRESSISYFVLALLALLTIFALVLDFLGSLLGAKKLGATWRGMLGATLGAVVGLFFSLPGLILGPIIGAFVLEFAGGRAWKDSAKAGAGALVGMALGAMGKLVCCVLMIALFCLGLIGRRSPVAGPASALAARGAPPLKRVYFNSHRSLKKPAVTILPGYREFGGVERSMIA